MIRDIVMTQSGNSTIPLTDINAANVSLLLNGDGTNGAQNNTFIDSSVNNATITRYGDTTQGSFSPFGNSWSNYFDGTGDYLTLPSSTNYTLDGDFTLEYWINQTGTPADYICHFIMYTSGANLLYTHTNSSGKLIWGVNSDRLSQIGTSIFNTGWRHVSVTRSGGTARLFLDGVMLDSYVSSDTISAAPISIAMFSGGRFPTAHFSNVRLLKGTALYTANFTPSTTPLTAVAGTVLLTCNSNNFKDNSVNNAAITPYGDTKVVKDSPFPEIYDKAVQGASAYFDGTGDYLTSTYSSFGAGDFTVEFWVNPLRLTGYQCLVDTRTTNASDTAIWIGTNGAGVEIYGNGLKLATTGTITPNQWYHILVARSGSTVYTFRNGVSTGSFTSSVNFTSTLFTAGVTAGGNMEPFQGYLSNVRVIKGTALYISNFTPPTSPLTAIANTSLLLKCDNAGIVDATGKNDLVTYGNAQVSTAQKKYGTGAMYFSSTSTSSVPDYVKVNNTPSIDIKNGDFTFECYFNTSSVQNYSRIINWNSTWTTDAIACSINPSNKIAIGIYNIVNNMLVSTTTISLNTWYHIVFLRTGSTFKLYINGILEASYTSAVACYNTTTPYITIGGGDASVGGYSPFTGYIDDLRITKGVARYTANFTPPTQSLSL